MGSFMLLILAILGFLLYFLPCIISGNRNATNGGAVFMVNLLFGWTLIGWLVAMIMAITAQTEVSAEIERETLRQLRAKANK
ncbi:hypothetical protein GCM10010909_02370 [Acidocella aquatica]|uniref:Superinfection immunity protein n=1 Tax=Acidocella aquatica TaxID=1922313 RepID=A0ABQ5ZZD1_9PROT|nr:superinfection immunity protein [Acidocella aquatica]GLR65559.1 hypothetical protein GCM10010909_02370 [Acidocella aquatica]